MKKLDRIPEWGRAQIAILLEYGSMNGITSERCLANTGLTEAMLAQIEPSKAQEAQVIQNLLGRLQAHPFQIGLDVGRRCDLRTFGVLGQALLASKSVLQAAELASRYMSGDLHFNRIYLHKTSDAVFTIFEPVGSYSEAVMQFILARDMGASITFHEHILRNVPELLLEIGFVSDWLPGMEILEQHFDCEVKVKQSRNYTKGNGIKHCLTMPFANSFMYDQFDLQLQRLFSVNLLAKKSDRPLKEQIEEQFEINGFQSISREQMAKRLHVSARTLARYLQSEGTTWRLLITDIRLSKAKALLRSSKLSIENIALAVGYSSASAFSVAFSREALMSPVEFRLSSCIKPEA